MRVKIRWRMRGDKEELGKGERMAAREIGEVVEGWRGMTSAIGRNA